MSLKTVTLEIHSMITSTVVASMVLLSISELISPTVFVQHNNQYYQIGSYDRKQGFATNVNGCMAVRNVVTQKTHMSQLIVHLPKHCFSRTQWAVCDGEICYARSMNLSMNNNATSELYPVLHGSKISMLIETPTPEELGFSAEQSKLENLAAWSKVDLNRAYRAGDIFQNMVFPEIYEHKDIGKIPFALGLVTPQPLKHTQQISPPPGMNYTSPHNAEVMLYVKEQDKVHQLCYSNSNPLLRGNLKPWNTICRIPINVTGDFSVYQTTRNGFCLLDSNRLLYYIAPIGGGAMVKKVSKLDYPVKIVYSGKTVDIIASNLSYHLDDKGQLSSPAKTVWPLPKK
jgi:hypothetical protein